METVELADSLHKKLNWLGMIAVCSLPGDPSPFQYANPKAIFSAGRLSEVIDVLAETQRLADANGWIAIGFVSYEAAPAFDGAFLVKAQATTTPLAYFCLYDPRERSIFKPESIDGLAGLQWKESISRNRYKEGIAHVKECIRAGETYQVNYTFRLYSEFKGDPDILFARMHRHQPTPYSLFLKTSDFAVNSVSPELFFHLEGNTIVCRPMKGTIHRGSTVESDAAQSKWLGGSEKNKAENVMIVDMIRNDLGRIARTGSVSVEKLFALEEYPTLWQMTSTVSAKTDVSVADIFRALFPCASITGAPKVRTMEIIRAIECSPRGIYTGALGYILPNRVARFSVAIRTAFVDRKAALLTLGVGGGIVYDSNEEAEYNEAMLKAEFLKRET